MTVIGYGVLRTLHGDTRGKTLCSYSHALLPSREAAEKERNEQCEAHARFPQYTFDVVEVRLADKVPA